MEAELQRNREETDKHKERAKILHLENERLLQMLTSRERDEEYLA